LPLADRAAISNARWRSHRWQPARDQSPAALSRLFLRLSYLSWPCARRKIGLERGIDFAD
jgi:hypothetical protein